MRCEVATPLADEAGFEIADAGRTARPDGVAVIGVDPEGVMAGAAALVDELFPESISRFKRLRSARISEAT